MLYHVGNMLFKLREKMGVSQEWLGRGLTDKAELSRLENGGKEADRFLIEALFQRLGKSADKFEMAVSGEEYRLLLLHSLILEKLTEKDYAMAALFLEEYQAQPDSGKPLHRQFVLEQKALLDYCVGGDAELCRQGLVQALEVTFPEWREEGWRGYSLCTQEVQILLLLLWVTAEAGEGKPVRRRLEELLSYLSEKYTDQEALAEVYPQCAWLLARECLRGADYGQAQDACSRGLKCLAENGIITLTDRLLEVQEECFVKSGWTEEAVKAERMRSAVLFLYEITGRNVPDDITGLLIVCGREEVVVNREILKDLRLFQGMSQQELSDGICSWETLSRIESGRRKPNRKNLHKMYEKLKLDRETYYSYIQTDDFELYEKVYRIKRKWLQENVEEIYALLEELETKLDMNEPVNRQFVESCRLLQALRNGELNEDSAIQEAERILRYTMKDYNGIVYRVPSREECVLLNRIALCLKRTGRGEEAIRLWEQILEKFRGSEVSGRHHMVSEALIYVNYSGMLEELNYLEKAKKEGMDGLDFVVRCQRGDIGGLILANLSFVYEKSGGAEDMKICEEYVRNSRCILSFYVCSREEKALINHYSTVFQESGILDESNYQDLWTEDGCH